MTLFPNTSLLLTDRNDEIATLDRRKFVTYDVVGGRAKSRDSFS